MTILWFFRFDKNYELIFPLEYPLHTVNKHLKGATVGGHQINFPKESLIDAAFVSANKGNKLMILSAEIKNLDLLKRDFYSNLENFSYFANAFVNKKGG